MIATARWFMESVVGLLLAVIIEYFVYLAVFGSLIVLSWLVAKYFIRMVLWIL